MCALSFPLNTQVSETDRLCWNLLFVGSLSLSLFYFFLVLLGFPETKVQAIPPFLQPYWVGGGGKSVGACTTTLLEKDITRMWLCFSLGLYIILYDFGLYTIFYFLNFDVISCLGFQNLKIVSTFSPFRRESEVRGPSEWMGLGLWSLLCLKFCWCSLLNLLGMALCFFKIWITHIKCCLLVSLVERTKDYSWMY